MLAKGMKRKRSEDDGDPSLAAPSSSLLSLSVSKLHQSLQRVDPNLRHLVLVTNTLRRLQDEMQLGTAPVPQPALGWDGAPADGGSAAGPQAPDPLACTLQDACRRLPVPPLSAELDQLLLSDMDASVFSTILEDLGGLEGFGGPVHPSVPQPAGGQDCMLSPEPERTPPACPSEPLDLLGPGCFLLEEDAFEDIDASMYNCDLWSPTALPNLKEVFSSLEAELPVVAELDHLVDTLMEAQEL
ncbi:SERTA domain-containing protein 1 [Varanus komodoensis]|uniref:SERTA domain-containing protein 1 n=1 Tax=Varanus komodoensis TaxID=61221 RepID=UPI001CF7C39D|nr:SERTA domain-containing protein 1 [Varanus komodoensis]XP_044281331.1 SERTA domain-containing protein 1 [Varanus komodoensis]